VALSDTAAPGASGTSFTEFGAPRLNLSGHTAFTAQLAGPGVDEANNAGVWSERSGVLSLVARTGSTAPGTSAMFRSIMGVPQFNALGQTAFRADLIGAGVTDANDQGIWSEGGGSLALVARTGDEAPGAGGLEFTKPTFMHPKSPPSIDAFGNPGLNDVGQTAFHAHLPSIGFDTYADGVWSEGNGTVALVARTGDNAPGTGGATFTSVGPGADHVPIYESGHVAFGGGLTGPGVTPGNNGGVWLNQNGANVLFARRGDAAPDISGAIFGGVSLPRFNDAGQYAFFATVVGPGITTENNRAIWSNGSGSLKLLVRAGNIAPGTGGAKFDLQSSSVKVNDRGETLFFSSLTGPAITMDNSFGIWVGKDDALRLIVRRGDIAPGTSGAFFFFPITSSVDLNAMGQTAFLSSLVGPGVTEANRWGIWVVGLDGVQRLIVRSGDSLEVAPGDFRVIESLGMSDGGFNDAGQLAFRAVFTDGSQGIFVSSLIAVPEPSNLAMMYLVIVLLGNVPLRRSVA
jgi:hypothetical protein